MRQGTGRHRGGGAAVGTTSVSPPRRRLLPAPRIACALLIGVAVVGCVVRDAPNSTLVPHSDFGGAIDALWREVLGFGAFIFVLVESLLIVAVIKFRQRPGHRGAKQTAGDATLEILWTALPAVILAVIALPTIRTIFRTQAKAPRGALAVEVIGHQWWWEFRYPQYGVVTANDLYLPVGRTVNFSLRTQDVLHSFWIPEMGGKRDLIANHTNYLWFTPQATGAWNGFCAEYCGASHANMHFHVFTVPPAAFAQWVAHQLEPAHEPVLESPQKAGASTAPSVTAREWSMPNLPVHVAPTTPLPVGAAVTSPVAGDPVRGAALFRRSACIACHTVTGLSSGVVGPSLTHVGSRSSIAAGLYPNDDAHLRAWIADAPRLKPGSVMPALGQSPTAPGGLTPQQVADLAAYLLTLQ